MCVIHGFMCELRHVVSVHGCVHCVSCVCMRLIYVCECVCCMYLNVCICISEGLWVSASVCMWVCILCKLGIGVQCMYLYECVCVHLCVCLHLWVRGMCLHVGVYVV